MSITAVLNTATSGLQAAQAGLRAVSDNIANVNTPGYVRKNITQQQLVVDGRGMGVQVTGVQRVTDQYLQSASLTAGSDASRWDVYSNFMDNAQSLFGDPSASSYFFTRLDDIYADFAAAADDPSSSLLRSQGISDVQDFLGEANRINTQLSSLGSAVDGEVSNNVARANDLLSQIDKLNTDISRAKLVNSDASGSENLQDGLVNELSTLMSVKVAARDNGGVVVRSADGVLLAGDGAAKLAYVRSDTTRGYITATSAAGVAQPLQITGGEIRGLLDLRDDKLPGLSDQLGEFVSRATDQLNAAHNDSVSFPAPTSLTGRATGLDLPTAVSNFTGKTTLAIVNAAGVIQRQVDVDFDAGTMSVDGVPAGAFTPANFLARLNTNLGAFGSASYSASGALSIAATGTNGVAMDEGTSAKAGKGFSHFFGLNDLVRGSGITDYDTGLKATDNHGFTPGDTITLALSQPDGRPISNVTITVPAAPLMSDMLASLNNNTTGVGLYGQFTLDANGALSFTGTAPLDAQLSVVQDNTKRGAGGPALSELFGLGVQQRTSRAGRLSVDPALVAAPTRLALGKLDTTVAAGTPAIRAGDGTGALAIAQSGTVTTQFQAAGSLGQIAMTVSAYSAEFGGSIGRDAASADSKKASAAAVQTEATTRLQSVEGVNLDEELVRLTTYQQAFNASARLIQASKDLYDVLLGLV